ncbi:hypothetical protein AS888_00095 [Peribacillus simplex]|uniref:Helix-turn-helix domain-containing protein n=1 Tax=Peribacillus simplex TaxID=1478 RepID=A0A120GQ36_9BACI|nr:hypothetical protein [Peribacillus simplex]KWW20729.1 hypothetical protein AS888_00095 [Peribacillus simplex]
MLVAGRIENFKDYSKFSSIKEFNNTIEMFLAEHKKDFTKGELVAFKRLVRFSAKYAGVANAKIGTILKAINEKLMGFGVSRSTFERMLRKAKKLGIVSIVNTKKSKGGKGHNVYIFNTIDVFKKRKLTHCENQEKPCDSKVEPSNFERETSNLLETSKKKNLNIRKNVHLDATFTASYVPKEFVQAVQPFFDQAAVIENFWKSVFLDTKSISHIVKQETITYTAIDAFKQSVRGYKRGKVKTNFVRYFTGTFKKRMDQVYSELPLHVFSSHT